MSYTELQQQFYIDFPIFMYNLLLLGLIIFLVVNMLRNKKFAQLVIKIIFFIPFMIALIIWKIGGH